MHGGVTVVQAGVNHVNYRADIDGLRAVAVLSVLLFHAKIPGFDGGFVGVDIFFVISGFLITSIIRGDQAKDRFSFVKFYERRVRRIMPALYVVTTVTIIASCFVLLPSDLSGAAYSAIASMLFVSNIYFWRTGGYFAGVSEEKPLLHTWSLSVEEQFYLIFPIILFLTFRYARSKEAIVIWVLLAASFLASVFGIYINKETPTFYLLPTRAWELMVGAVLALKMVPALPERWRSPTALAGLVLILVPVVLFDSKTPFPGMAALPPVLGAAFLIHAGVGGTTIASPLLTAKPVVWIGLFSYSLYLWHWPILVLSRYYLVRELTLVEAIAAIGLAFALAYLSWRFVEQPFRRANLKTFALFGGAGAMGAAIVVGSAAVVVNDGFPQRFSAEVARINETNGRLFKCPVTQYVPFGRYVACPFKADGATGPASSNLIVWGDSHAQMYVPAIRARLSDEHSGRLVSVNGCPPLTDRSSNRTCLNINKSNAEEILKSPDQVIVLALHWERYKNETMMGVEADAEGYRAIIDGLRRTVSTLQSGGKTVVVVGPILTPGYNISSAMSRSIAFDRANAIELETARGKFESEFSEVMPFLTELEGQGVEVIYPHTALCRDERCSFLVDGIPAFADGNHVTSEFAAGLSPMFRSTAAAGETAQRVNLSQP